MSAVQARIYYAMKQEFKLLKGIIRDYTPEEYSYEPEVGDRRAKQSDYDNVDVIPVSDPNAATMSQKVVQYQAVMQMAQQYPQIYDLPELNKQMLEVLGIKNIGKLIPTTEDQKPKDPVSENMAILNSKPVKAFMYQDHKAHIDVHMAFKNDPKIAQLVGQSPMAQPIIAAMEAHLAEHLAFEYRRQIEEQLGTPLPSPEQELPPEAEIELSKLVAQAGQQLLQKNQAEAAQQQAQQQMQDPIVQMQQAELQLKQQELALKAQTEAQKIQLEMAKIQSQEKIAGVELGSKIAMDKEKVKLDMAKENTKQMQEGLKLGLEAVNKERNNIQKEDQITVDALNKLAEQLNKSNKKESTNN